MVENRLLVALENKKKNDTPFAPQARLLSRCHRRAILTLTQLAIHAFTLC
jgi:hypothetical protein